MNQQSNDIPTNPVIAITNLPEPQVISGTLGEEGNPLPAQHAGNLVNILDTNLLTFSDYIGSATLRTSMGPGTSVCSLQLPYAYAPFIYQGDSPYKAPVVNWNSFPLRCHEYYDCVEDIQFTLVAPSAMVGKLLCTYDPTILRTDMADWASSIYREDRRKITKELDLAETKTFSISIQGYKLDHKRPTQRGETPRVSNQQIRGPSTSLHDFSTSIGSVNLSVLQRLQKLTLYPESFTILVSASFSKSVMYTPSDPRTIYGGGGYQTTHNFAFGSDLFNIPQ